jgi:hypothetical protein
MYKELPEYRDVPEEILRDIIRSNYFDHKIIKQIKSVYNDLIKGPTGKLGEDLVLFQKALTTSHNTGSMIDYIPNSEKSGIDAAFFKDLSEGTKYIPIWNKEIKQYASNKTKYISKRINDTKNNILKNINGLIEISDKITTGQIKREQKNYFWIFAHNDNDTTKYFASVIESNKNETDNRMIFRFSSTCPIKTVS